MTYSMSVHPAYYDGGVPVFTPTYDEFKDFYAYNKAINPYGMQSGIVKVIPPREWSSQLDGIYTEDNLNNAKIKRPIVQQINGEGNGVFTIQNVERARTFNLQQWLEILRKLNYQPPRDRRREKKAPKENELQQEATEVKPYSIDITQYSPERCDDLEKTYWRSLTYAEPMYGADMLGSLFPEKITSWNVSSLPNILDLMDAKVPGVNDAYLYAGLWKATFAWHLEDQDLYLINYLHFGAPKQWYLIPQLNAGKFFDLMKETFADEYKQCLEFLRHKTFTVLPQFLDKHGIAYNKIVHREGEFMITYPYGYHAGFNFGYNLAESVNFALDDWFPIGEVTKKCECIPDSVGINIQQLLCRYRGIPCGSEDSDATEDEPLTEDEKILVPEKKLAAKKQPKSEPNIIKMTPKINSPPKPPQKTTFQCSLCTNNLSEAVIRFPMFKLIPADNGQFVHMLCYRAFPEQLILENGMVYGMRNISKAQKKLKCGVCGRRSNNSHGACFQCAHPKCTRAFHATCAMGDLVLFDKENGEALCRFHRPKLGTGNGNVCANNWVQFTKGKTPYGGLVLQNNTSEQMYRLSVYPQLTEEIEVPYADVMMTPPTSRKRHSDPGVSYTNTQPENYITKRQQNYAVGGTELVFDSSMRLKSGERIVNVSNDDAMSSERWEIVETRNEDVNAV